MYLYSSFIVYCIAVLIVQILTKYGVHFQFTSFILVSLIFMI